MDLVAIRNKNTVCSSLEVAEHFEKRHADVIRAIENFIQNDSTQNCAQCFKRSFYKDMTGKKNKMYFMNRDGFTFLTMGFTGQKANEWKWQYIEAFNRMEQLLAMKQTQVYQETRSYQKQIRKQEADTIKLYVEYAIKQGSSNAARYYSSLSRLADKAAGIEYREYATLQQLNNLALVENIITQCITSGIELQEPYKNIYCACKAKLEQFSKIVLIS